MLSDAEYIESTLENEEVPEDYRESIREQLYITAETENVGFNRNSDCIFLSFCGWMKSPQGQDFWVHLHHKEWRKAFDSLKDDQ